MLTVDIPGVGKMSWEYLLLDVNGTLAVDGVLVDGVARRIRSLSNVLDIRLITANAHGNADALAEALGVPYHQVPRGEEQRHKRGLALTLGPDKCIAIGNGNNDAHMLQEVSLGIAVLSDEGTASAVLQASDMIAPSILVALDCLLKPARLSATLRR